MKKNVIGTLLCIVISIFVTEKITELILKFSKEKEKKMEQYYHILNQWLDIRQNNKGLNQYFKQKGYQKIGIYGMKELGQRLYYELKDSNLQIKLIDKAAESIWFEDDIISPVDEIPDVDVIVITAAYYFDSIKKEIENKVKCPIISISDVVKNSL